MTLLPYLYGLSPQPASFFNGALVVIGFRGFPEFGGLAAASPLNEQPLQLDGYITDTMGRNHVPIEAITLFSL